MKEKFEIFKNEKTVVNVRSQKQYDDFIKMCEQQGLKWNSGNLATTRNFYYNDYKEETCIDLNNLKYLDYCDINFYKNEGYKIITYKDFMKKSNHQQELTIERAECIANKFNNLNIELQHYDLNEEIEIIEEEKPIKKIEINYARDIEEKIFYEESDKPNHCILGDAGTELLINKINEIIDKLNELKKESDK